MNYKIFAIVAVWVCSSGGLWGAPLGANAFTYQGALSAGGSPANGVFDLRFGLCTAASFSAPVAAVTNSGVLVSNGIFTTTLDFGADYFNGTPYWLEVAVRTNGSGAVFGILDPRQALTPAPYSLYSAAAGASSGLSVNGQRVLRVEPGTSPGLIAGHKDNRAGTGLEGVTIAGGGANFRPNEVFGNFGTVGGGKDNTSGENATVAGGQSNAATGDNSAIAGGDNNHATGQLSTIGGGSENDASGRQATINGGRGNVASQENAVIGGGLGNTASGTNSTVPGGSLNLAAGDDSFAAGRRAKALHAGSFVWADSTEADFPSTAANQLRIRAAGGVGIEGNLGVGTDIPRTRLELKSPIDGEVLRFGYGATDYHFISTGFHGGRPEVNYLGFNLESTSSDVRRVLTLRGDGRVGIGTANPTTELDVNGVITAQGFVGSTANITGSAVGGLNVDGKLINVNNTSLNATAFGITAKGNTGIKATSISGNIARLGTPSYAGDFTGPVRVSESVTANGVVLTSDRNAKMDFAPIDAKEILRRTVGLRLERWSFTNAPGVRHIGPMAQDFYAAFNLGEDDRHIFTVDADGVALACIQALHGALREKEVEIAELKTRVAALAEQVQAQNKTAANWQSKFSKLEQAVARIAATSTAKYEETRSEATEEVK